MKLIQPQVVIDATRQMGWAVDPTILTVLGLILLASTALYAFPQTAMLGTILLTGYLGGDVASHVRNGDPLFTNVLFGVYLGLFVGRAVVSRCEDPRVDPIEDVANRSWFLSEPLNFLQ